MRKRLSGFTLIELLVVIGIIAILAAIIFPVFARAKASAFKNADIAEMNGLRSALQLYRADQGAYPPQLLGYVTLYTSGPNSGNVIPADQIKSYLYPSRTRSITDFQPANNKYGFTETTYAVYPNRDPRAVGAAPILDLNADGIISPLDDPADARQAYDSTSGRICVGGIPESVQGANCGSGALANFYRISGYDVAEIPGKATTNNTARTELRYTLFWTSWGLGMGSGLDDPRQLGYSDPPENTVITWDSYFRDYNETTHMPVGGRHDVALFVGGAARPFDSGALHTRAWRVTP